MKKKTPPRKPKSKAQHVEKLDEHLSDRPHGSGLVDLGFWIELFHQHPELIQPPEKGSRRGRIWT